MNEHFISFFFFNLLGVTPRAPLTIVICTHVLFLPQGSDLVKVRDWLLSVFESMEPLDSLFGAEYVQFVKPVVFLLSELTNYFAELIERLHYSDIVCK